MNIGLKSTVLCLSALLFAASLQAAEKSSYRLIEEAFTAGQLTYEEKMLFEVQSIRNQSALPEQFRSQVLETAKCATDILVEVRTNWDDFSESSQAQFREIMARPTNSFTYNSPGGQFKIHYSTSGTNAVPTADTSPANGIPDYVEWIAAYADSSYKAEITNLGHRVPPSDGVAGGDARYDIYTEEMPYYGYTQPEGAGPESWNDAISFVSVHRNFSGFPPNNDPEGDQKGAAKVTVAHEYYHAIQFAYDVGENSWFMEACATWMEDFVYELVDDNYNYMSDFFDYPDYALNSNANLHMYAAFIWPMYLQENYGSLIMPQIWDELRTTQSYAGTGNILANNYGANLNQAVADFTMWNFITGSRNDGQHYAEASSYLQVPLVRTHNAYPVSNQAPITGKYPDAYGSNYVRFNIPANASTFTVEFNGDNATPWIVNLLAWKTTPTNIYAEYQMTLNVSGDGSFELSNANSWNSLIMVITNVSQSVNDRSYSYGASFTTAPNVAVQVVSVADDSVYSATGTSVEFEVENTGLAAEIYDITVANSLGWTQNFSPSSALINPGEKTTVNVNLTAPAGVMPGTINAVNLTAEATSIVGVTDSDTANVLVVLLHGDADNSGVINISDAVYLIQYIFASGPIPLPVLDAGDANCTTPISISDAVFLINYIFNSGPYPPCNPW